MLYLEISDRAHLRVNNRTEDVDLTVELPHTALYDYVDTVNPNNKRVVIANGGFAEHLTPKQKNKPRQSTCQSRYLPGGSRQGPLSNYLVSY